MRVVVLAASSEDDESHSAFDWAKRNRFDACRLSPNEFRAQLASADVVWCHAPSSVPFLPDDALHILREWLHKGGRLLLSLLATPLAQRLGAPGAEPLVELPRQWTGSNDALWPDDFRDWPDYPHIRGVQGWEAHPLFDGLQRGTYTWQGREGVTVCRSYYRSPVWPEGRVVGVDRAYVQLDAGTAIAWEFEVDKGRILCLGANVHLGAPNDGLAAQRGRLLTNAIAYLDPQRPHSNDVRSWWPNGVRGVRQDDALIPPMALNVFDETGEPSTLVFNSASPDDSVFTLAGRRTLVTGTEREGVKEVWFHPICLSSEGEAWSANGIA
ncbi:MAG: hypothetical protein ABIT38_05355, partial [Gemmatimonadaceae bacterium]